MNGQVYLFEADGTLCTGWQTVDGIRCYYDPFTAKICTGWICYQQNYYYIDDDSGKCSGVQRGLTALDGTATSTSTKFLFDSYGALQLGYVTYTDGYHYYADEETGAVVTGYVKYNGTWYRFGADGRQATGWVAIQSNRYYFDTDTGEGQIGLVMIGSNSYYIMASGGMQMGYQKIDGKAYYFKSGRVMLQNEKVTVNGVLYQAGADGVLKKITTEKTTQTLTTPVSIMGTSQATVAQM